MNSYIKIANTPCIKMTSMCLSNVFCMDSRWYLRIKANNSIAVIDEQCEHYAQQKNLIYKSCIFENSFVVKVPYRYKKFEVQAYNCTLYDEIKNKNAELDLQPVAISLVNGKHTLIFKLKTIKLNCQEKHPHALLGYEEDAE